MLTYWLTLVTIAGTALIAGHIAALRGGHLMQAHPRRFALGGLTLAATWFLLAWFGRIYAETDHFGWPVAEWFAHGGKWFAFLAIALGAFAFSATSERLAATDGASSSRPGRRIVFVVAAVAVAAAVFHRTVPIHPWLDAGRRDVNGRLRQSLRYQFTCAPVALANYLEQFQGRANLSEAEVARACGTTREGSTQSKLRRAAHGYGLGQVECRKLSLPELNDKTLPAIVSITTMTGVRHATLLVKLHGETAYFLDPDYGEWTIPVSRFRQIWYGKTLVLGPRGIPPAGQSQ